MKDAGCDRTIKQIRHWWETLKKILFLQLHVKGNISGILIFNSPVKQLNSNIDFFGIRAKN